MKLKPYFGGILLSIIGIAFLVLGILREDGNTQIILGVLWFLVAIFRTVIDVSKQNIPDPE